MAASVTAPFGTHELQTCNFVKGALTVTSETIFDN